MRTIVASLEGEFRRYKALADRAVGQIVFLAKQLRGPEWQYLSILPGRRAEQHAGSAERRPMEPNR